MTMVRYLLELPSVRGTLHDAANVSVELRIACLWSAFGLTVTGLFFAMGLGAEIGQALMAAG